MKCSSTIQIVTLEKWKPTMPELTHKTAVGYVRLSDRGANGTEVSLERQRDEIRSWCKRNGVELIAVFEDVGKSGRKVNRKGLNQAISECSLRDSLLVSFALDRIARSQKVLDRLKSERIAFRALDFPEVSELMLDVLIFAHNMYSRMVSKKMTAYHKHRKERVERGEATPHPVPTSKGLKYGDPESVAHARQVRVKRSKDKRKTVWEHIRPLHESGMSPRKIAQRLDEMGINPLRRAKPGQPAGKWNHVSVRRIIDQFTTPTTP